MTEDEQITRNLLCIEIRKQTRNVKKIAGQHYKNIIKQFSKGYINKYGT